MVIISNFKLVCLEKNPDSFHYLQRNISRNQLSNWVTPFLGDNREMANEYLGKFDRVLMGYIPTPLQFLHRAFDFLKVTRLLPVIKK
jgi:tRNA wybutosine-synthesizing protein 2